MSNQSITVMVTCNDRGNLPDRVKQYAPSEPHTHRIDAVLDGGKVMVVYSPLDLKKPEVVNGVYDHFVRERLPTGPGLAVSWWLLGSCAYYLYDENIISDTFFDELTQYLRENFHRITHVNKELITESMLSVGSAYNLKRDDYPIRVQVCTDRLIKELYLQRNMRGR